MCEGDIHLGKGSHQLVFTKKKRWDFDKGWLSSVCRHAQLRLHFGPCNQLQHAKFSSQQIQVALIWHAANPKLFRCLLPPAGTSYFSQDIRRSPPEMCRKCWDKVLK